MSDKKVMTPWGASIPEELIQSEKLAQGTVAEVIAGKTTWLYEWTTGASATLNETPQVAPNPQGTYGHDHSGPPYGAAIPHPFANNYSSPSGATTTDWTRVWPQKQVATNGTLWLSFNYESRPFANLNGYGPYSKIYFHVLASAVTGTTNNLKVEIIYSRNVSTGLETRRVTKTVTVGTAMKAYGFVEFDNFPGVQSANVLLTNVGTPTISVFSAGIDMLKRIRADVGPEQ